jgi:hypothetical protein
VSSEYVVVVGDVADRLRVAGVQLGFLDNKVVFPVTDCVRCVTLRASLFVVVDVVDLVMWGWESGMLTALPVICERTI